MTSPHSIFTWHMYLPGDLSWWSNSVGLSLEAAPTWLQSCYYRIRNLICKNLHAIIKLSFRIAFTTISSDKLDTFILQPIRMFFAKISLTCIDQLFNVLDTNHLSFGSHLYNTWVYMLLFHPSRLTHHLGHACCQVSWTRTNIQCYISSLAIDLLSHGLGIPMIPRIPGWRKSSIISNAYPCMCLQENQ